jgi:hypothetical protein
MPEPWQVGDAQVGRLAGTLSRKRGKADMTETPAPPADVHAAAAQGDGSLPVGHLPNQGNCPAIPYWALPNGNPDWVHAYFVAAALQARANKADPAYDGLTTPYTIAGQTQPASDFLYPPKGGARNKLNELAVDNPSQFTLPWTNYDNVCENFHDVVEAFAASLTSMPVATASSGR